MPNRWSSRTHRRGEELSTLAWQAAAANDEAGPGRRVSAAVQADRKRADTVLPFQGSGARLPAS